MADLPFADMGAGASQSAAPGQNPDDKKKQSGGLFSSKPKAAPVDLNKQISVLTNSINDMNRRLRVMEEKFTNLDKKIKLNEGNILSNFKKVNMSIATFHDEINDFSRHLKIDDERIELIIKELKLTSKKEDVIVLQRYIELWDPVKFATHNEIEKVVQEKLGEALSRSDNNQKV